MKTHRQRLLMMSDVYRAIGQPMRLGILELLQEKEMKVGEIAVHLGIHAATVSKHVALLRGLGIVRGRRDGLGTYCTLAMPQLGAFIRCVEGYVDQRIVDHQITSGEPDGGVG